MNAAGAVLFAALYQAALTHAPALGVAAAEARRAAFEQDRARSGLLPRVTAQGGAQAWSQGNTPSGLGSQLRPNSQEAWEVGAEQTVFQGGEVLNRYRAAGSTAQAALHLQAAERSSLLRDTGTWALKLLEAQEALKQADAELERRQGHLDATKKRAAAGDLSETDAVRAEAEASRARSERIEAERAVSEARSRLESLTGLDLSAGVVPPQALALPSGTAAADNPEVLAGRESLKAAEEARAAEKGRFLPAIAVGGATRGTREAPKSLLFVERESYGFIQARWALFSGGEKVASARSAQAAAEKAAEELRLRKDAQALESKLALDAAKAAESSIAAETARRDSAQAAYDRVKKRFDAGLDPYLNLLDASAALKDAESGLLRARYARERSVLEFYRASGGLEAAVLGKS